jgi:hypothetical protein
MANSPTPLYVSDTISLEKLGPAAAIAHLGDLFDNPKAFKGFPYYGPLLRWIHSSLRSEEGIDSILLSIKKCHEWNVKNDPYFNYLECSENITDMLRKVEVNEVGEIYPKRLIGNFVEMRSPWHFSAYVDGEPWLMRFHFAKDELLEDEIDFQLHLIKHFADSEDQIPVIIDAKRGDIHKLTEVKGLTDLRVRNMMSLIRDYSELRNTSAA